MKICLQCQKEFKPKRERAKFCSDLCRATFHQNLKSLKKVAGETMDDKEVAGLYAELMRKIKGVKKAQESPNIIQVVQEPAEDVKVPDLPKETANISIGDKPVRRSDESGLDYSIRLMEWKDGKSGGSPIKAKTQNERWKEIKKCATAKEVGAYSEAVEKEIPDILEKDFLLKACKKQLDKINKKPLN